MTIIHLPKSWGGASTCKMCNKTYEQSLSVEQRTLPFIGIYSEMLFRLEEGLERGRIRDAIREEITRLRSRKEFDCLVYLVDRLYPDHKEMLEKLIVLK